MADCLLPVLLPVLILRGGSNPPPWRSGTASTSGAALGMEELGFVSHAARDSAAGMSTGFSASMQSSALPSVPSPLGQHLRPVAGQGVHSEWKMFMSRTLKRPYWTNVR